MLVRSTCFAALRGAVAGAARSGACSQSAVADATSSSVWAASLVCFPCLFPLSDATSSSVWALPKVRLRQTNRQNVSPHLPQHLTLPYDAPDSPAYCRPPPLSPHRLS